MKLTLLKTLAVLLIGGAAACSKDSASPKHEYFMKAQKDGAGWEVPAQATYTKATKTFYLFGEDGKPATTQGAILRLAFSLPSKEETSPINVLPAEWSVLVGGDVIVDSYSTTEAGTMPELVVTRLDTVQKIIEGRFSASLRRDKHWSQAGEEMKFKEGSFKVNYQVFQ